MKEIKNASIYQLSQVDGFAEITAQYLRDGVEKLYPQMKEVLDSNKITIEEVRTTGGRIEGISFCFTGKLENMKRAEAEQLVMDNGGQAKSGVVANLSYLVTNSNEPKAKYVKAQRQGAKIIAEEEFLKMIE